MEERPGNQRTDRNRTPIKHKMSADEAIVEIINDMHPRDRESFLTLCKLIEITEFKKGHKAVSDVLTNFATKFGYTKNREFVYAIESLRDGLEPIGKGHP